MDGMSFIDRDRQPESWQECRGAVARYAAAACAVFLLTLGILLAALALLDHAGIHLPIVDDGADVSAYILQ